MKNKNDDKFPLCYRGYDKDAVKKFIALQDAKAVEFQNQQRECIRVLKSENDNLKNELAIFKSREEQVKLALVNASDSAKRFEADVKERYEIELERLKLFRAKWINAYEQLKERYHFDKDALNVESVAVSVEIELKKMLAKDFALDKAPIENKMEEHFRREVERLTDMQISRQEKVGQSSQLNNSQNASRESVDTLCNSLSRKDESFVKLLKPILEYEDETGIMYECEQGNKSLTDSEAQILKKKLEEIKTKRKKTSGDSVEFSLEDALNPKDSLEQNCQVLSLAKK